jgi:putative ABC transport system substrate-binding protein
MIGRREFIKVLGVAAAGWPLAARGQEPNRVRRIAVVANLLERDEEARRASEAFVAQLRNLGWVDRSNLSIDFRWVGDRFGEYGAAVKATVQSAPDVIVARGGILVQALSKETSAIPIVFVNVLDALALGVVQSLPRPGGNVTGFMTFDPAMGTKWLDIIKEIAPSLKRVGVALFQQPSEEATFKAIEAAAPALGVQATALPVRNAADIERGINAFASGLDGGLIVVPNSVTNANRELITRLAARYRLPAIYAYRFYLESGGLASYGIESTESFRSAAGYVDRILKGAKPSDLSVQAPTKFELSINLKAAKAIGLSVPPLLLARADEVIE